MSLIVLRSVAAFVVSSAVLPDIAPVSLQKANNTCQNTHNKSCWYNPGIHVVKSFKTNTTADCCQACNAEVKCLAFTMNFNNNRCYLKDGLEIQPHAGDCVSGGTILPPAPSPPPAPLPPSPPGALNVLFVVFDDLRPEFGAYGSHVPTPSFDRFATQAVKFTNAYIQYSFCCPSRNSFMSGRRPSRTKVWNFIDNFREEGIGDKWTSMPGWFKQQGYFVHGLGKLFHPNSPPKSDGALSWTDPANIDQGSGLLPNLPQLHVPRIEPSKFDSRAFDCITGEHGGSYCELNSTAGPDDELVENAVVSLSMLANYSKTTGHPFFLGVGIHKPHIPWTIPTRFFKPLGSIQDTKLPKHEQPPIGMPPMAFNKGLGTHALDSYADTNRYPLHVFQNGSSVPFPPDLTKAMRRGYYAAVSYVDALFGRLVDALDESAVADRTVVAMLGDHGYNLGELNLWCKMTVFESGTRIPMMIRAPQSTGILAGVETSSLAEAVDLYPTLAELATGLKVVEDVDGTSLAPVLRDAKVAVKDAAYSEFVKCYSCCNVPDDTQCQPGGAAGRCAPLDPKDLHEMGNCFSVKREDIDFIGYSVRSSNWRYTEWLHFNGTALHGDFTRMVANELYDHKGDDGGNHDWDAFENENVAQDLANADMVRHHHDLLIRGFPQASDTLPTAWEAIV